jgi:hypothetical protein
LFYQQETSTKEIIMANVLTAENFDAEVRKLNEDVARMVLPENIRATRLRMQAHRDRQEEATYTSKTQKFVIGALLRGSVRRQLALHTSLEVKEVKGFLESVFVLKAYNAKQFRELERVEAWIRRIASDG